MERGEQGGIIQGLHKGPPNNTNMATTLRREETVRISGDTKRVMMLKDELHERYRDKYEIISEVTNNSLRLGRSTVELTFKKRAYGRIAMGDMLRIHGFIDGFMVGGKLERVIMWEEGLEDAITKSSTGLF